MALSFAGSPVLGYEAVLGAPGQLRGFQHQVREPWRDQRYQAFLNSDWRDANMLQAVGYNPERLSRARTLSQNGNGHHKAVLCGAALSTAYYEMRRHGMASRACRWCGAQEPAGWDHLAWRCQAMGGGRPREPDDPLQRRLG